MKIIVKEDGALLEYLYNNLDMPKKKIKSYLTHGSIYVNSTRTTKYNYELIKGMTITINSNEKNTSSLPFDIVYEDDYIIVVNKPSGLLTIASIKEKDTTLYHLVGLYLKSKHQGSKVFIVHRLDKDTSGLVLLAKDEKTKNIFQEKWNEIVSVREYIAIVEGVPRQTEERLVNYLRETTTNLVYITKDNSDAKEAITSYQLIKTRGDYSELRIYIETGRKNQIRVQLENIGCPIVGDKKYNKNAKEKRLFLHANRLKVYNPISKQQMTFMCDVPVEFKKIMGKK